MFGNLDLKNKETKGEFWGKMQLLVPFAQNVRASRTKPRIFANLFARRNFCSIISGICSELKWTGIYKEMRNDSRIYIQDKLANLAAQTEILWSTLEAIHDAMEGKLWANTFGKRGGMFARWFPDVCPLISCGLSTDYQRNSASFLMF